MIEIHCHRYRIRQFRTVLREIRRDIEYILIENNRTDILSVRSVNCFRRILRKSPHDTRVHIGQVLFT